MEKRSNSDCCLVCGSESTVGCVGVTGGVVYHDHYCDDHYNKYKMKQDTTPKVVKWPELRSMGFSVKELNGGVQLVLKSKNNTIDFWPSTEKFMVRGLNIRGSGVSLLSNYV